VRCGVLRKRNNDVVSGEPATTRIALFPPGRYVYAPVNCIANVSPSLQFLLPTTTSACTYRNIHAISKVHFFLYEGHVLIPSEIAKKKIRQNAQDQNEETF